MTNPITSLIRWLTGSNGRTEDVKEAEEETAQRVIAETSVNLGKAKSHFRLMKECPGDESICASDL